MQFPQFLKLVCGRCVVGNYPHLSKRFQVILQKSVRLYLLRLRARFG
jgi:hypothetical protein